MKLNILSDLHLDHSGMTRTHVDCDAVLLAGDLSNGFKGVHWALATFQGTEPVFLISGNHESYGHDLETWKEKAQKIIDDSGQLNIRLLENEAVTLEKSGEPSVCVLGATLWTDFAIFGSQLIERHGEQVERALNDYRAISLKGRILTWQDTAELHRVSLLWLKREAAAARLRGEKVVVLSHHAPSLKSSLLKYKKDPISAGFVSDLSDFAAQAVDLWVHGHTHNSANYMLGACRVVANPRGYPLPRRSPDTSFENSNFNPAFVVEV